MGKSLLDERKESGADELYTAIMTDETPGAGG